MDTMMRENDITDSLFMIATDLRIVASLSKRTPFCAIQDRLRTIISDLEAIQEAGAAVLEEENRIYRESVPLPVRVALGIESGEMSVASCRVQEDGILLNGCRYWHDELQWHVGEALAVAYADLSSVFVFLRTEDFPYNPVEAALVEIQLCAVPATFAVIQEGAYGNPS